MLLKDLIKNVPDIVECIGDMNVEITSLCLDSRAVENGSLFFCTPGQKLDAHDFAPSAVKRGAAALIENRRLDLNVPQVVVKNVRAATSVIASEFYGNPTRQMKLIGLTGTKGKTTTSYLVKSIFEHAGFKTGYIGTVGSMIGEEYIPTTLTTPDPVEIQQLLRRMADEGVEYVVMEVSAHAIDMDRLYGMKFEVAGFSNFSQDHLDYFGTMENYLAAKMRLFEGAMVDKIAYNADDAVVLESFEKLGRESLPYGISHDACVYANDTDPTERGFRFTLSHHKHFKLDIDLKLGGLFNVYNALMAASIAVLAGVAPEAIKQGIEAVENVPGRVERLETNTPYVVILDYAHSPDALQNILSALNEHKKGRLIALFGCGGDRDHAKRPIMGEIAGRLADYCVLTSDNPRSEDPFDILKSIEEGIKKTDCEYVVIENRREAIRYAMEHAGAGDIICLAGKGHETYQEIKGVKYKFDEKVVVKELLAEMKVEREAAE